MRFRFLLIVAIFLLASLQTLAAQDNDTWHKRFSRETFESTTKNSLQYRMLVPQDMTDGTKYPLVLFLHGAFDAAMRWPDLFAAAAPICGGADTSGEAIEKMKSVPFWIAHGADDNVVPVEQSRTVVEALKKVGAEPHYVELAGVGHNSWAATFADEAFFEWLFSQKRNAR